LIPIAAWAAIILANVAATPGNVLPVLAGLLADRYAIDEGDLGVLLAVNTCVGLLTAATAPRWIAAVNLQAAIAAACVVVAVALFGLGHAHDMATLYVAEAALGGGAVAIASIAMTVIARLPNPARAWGIKVTGDVIFAGGLLWLFPTARFGLNGLVAVLAGLTVAAMPLLTRLPRHAVLDRPAPAAAAAAVSVPIGAWYALGAMVVFYTSGIGVWAFLERIARQAGLPAETIGDGIALGLFVGIVGSLGAAVYAGRSKALWPQAASGALFVASIAALALRGGLVSFYVAVFVFNAAWNFFMPFVVALVARRDPGGRLSALVPGTVMLGGIMGPPLAGLLIRAAGYPVMLLTMTAIAATAIVGYVVLERRS
jgi:hypothetical protein